MTENGNVRLGAIIKLKHVATNFYLRSLSRTLEPQPMPQQSSRQQMVVATSNATPETYWIVKGSHGAPEAMGNIPKHDSLIRLEHFPTRMNLHSHKVFFAPMSRDQQEVTAFSPEKDGIGDANDNWRLEIEGGGEWNTGKPLRLIHNETKVALHSHQRSDAVKTAGEHEVTGFSNRNQDDFWIASEIIGFIPLPTQDQADRLLIASDEAVQSMQEITTRFAREAEATGSLVKQSLDSVRAALVTSQTIAEVAATSKIEIESGRELLHSFEGQLNQQIGAGREILTELSRQKEVTLKEAEAIGELKEAAETAKIKLVEGEAKLAETLGETNNLRKEIEDLLAGATTIGLALAFDERRKAHNWPVWLWQGTFLLALALLLAVPTIDVYKMGWDAMLPATWQDATRHILSRLPFLVPLAWLAIHAAWQASLAKRLREEYAFKATVSKSFEGYRRQMAEVSETEITKGLSSASPLSQLCTTTLRTIAKPPGTVYDKQRKDPTPATAIAEIIGPAVEALANAVAAQLRSGKGDN